MFLNFIGSVCVGEIPLASDLKVIVPWKNPDLGDVAPQTPQWGRSASPTPPAQGLIGVMTFLKSVTFELGGQFIRFARILET